MPKRLKWGTIQYLEQLVNEYFDTHQTPTIAGLCLHLGITDATWKHYVSQRYRRLKCSPEEFEEYQTKKDENGIFEKLVEVSANTFVLDDGTQSIDDDYVKSEVSRVFQMAKQKIDAHVSEQIFSAKNPAGPIYYSKAALGYRETDGEAGNAPAIPASINIVVLPPPEKPKRLDAIEIKPLPPKDE